jgi:lysine-specific demethylase 3
VLIYKEINIQYSVLAPRYYKLTASIVQPTLRRLWLRPCRGLLRSFTMNALQDLSKKTSINSLLNPQEASAFPASVGANPGHHDNQGVIYATSFSNASSFHLRAASWDSVNETKRRAENGANGHHHLHPHQLTETYSDSRAPRMPRSRMGDIQPFPIEGPVWQPQQDVANMSYGASVVPPLYSAERTRKPISMYTFTFLTF